MCAEAAASKWKEQLPEGRGGYFQKKLGSSADTEKGQIKRSLTWGLGAAILLSDGALALEATSSIIKNSFPRESSDVSHSILYLTEKVIEHLHHARCFAQIILFNSAYNPLKEY